MILRLGTGSLAAARKGHSRARHFGTTFTFLVQIFLACGAQHNICTQCFIWEVGSAAASVQARVTRVLASCAFESPDGTILLGISAASSSFGAFSSSHARLRHCCHCCSRRRCSRRHVQCLPVVRMLLHCALLRRCASPVHGPCLALLRVAVLCVVLDRRLRSVCSTAPPVRSEAVT